MRIDGTRADGAVLVLLDGGLACVVRGNLSSPAVEEVEAQALGPWSPADSSLSARRAMTRRLELTRTAPLHAFRLAMPVVAPPVVAPPVVPMAPVMAPGVQVPPPDEAEPEIEVPTDADGNVDIEALQAQADKLTEEALKASDAAETAEEHRAASDALELAAEAQERVSELMTNPAAAAGDADAGGEGAEVPEMGTPEFDAYIEQEVAKRIAALPGQ